LPPTLSVPPTEAEVTTVNVLNVPLAADTVPPINPFIEVIAAAFTLVRAETFATTVLIEVIESRFVCVSAETAATSVLIEVIESRFVCVSAETAATSVTVAADTPAIKSSSVSILVAETIPNKADPVTASAVLTDTEPKF